MAKYFFTDYRTLKIMHVYGRHFLIEINQLRYVNNQAHIKIKASQLQLTDRQTDRYS